MSSFKHLILNSTAIFVLWIKVGFESRLSSDIAGVLMLSSDNTLDFHAKILSQPVSVVKDLKSGWITR